MAGVSTAYHLTLRGVGRVVLVDPRPPLSLTSDKSTECYRNWWPSKPMVDLVDRSIDLFEEWSAVTSNAFGLSRRGYLFVTASNETLEAMRSQAHVTSGFGAGDVREHPGPVAYGEYPDGVDILDAHELQKHFPFVTDTAVGAVHVRRAGWLSAQQLGAWLLDQARARGAALIKGEVTDIEIDQGRVETVVVGNRTHIAANQVVVAAGPMAAEVSHMAGVDLPLFSELHLKVAYREHLGVIPRDAPMIIWSDAQSLDWSPEERAELMKLGRDDLLGEMPVFCHGRPEGGIDSPYFMALWEYHKEVLEPEWPLPDDPLYPEAVMRGLTTMVPDLSVYLDGLPESSVDGGYYTKTRENRPLIGPCGPEGFHVVAGLSGFGIMASPAAGELAAMHIVGEALPGYAEDFLLGRYDDPGYVAEIEELTESGQL